MKALAPIWAISALMLACSSSPNETAGPDAALGGSGGKKPDASSGGSGGGGGTVGGSGGLSDASFGGSSEASVACDAGTHPVGSSCEPDQSCTGVDCGQCGSCVVNGGVAECQCQPGYQSSGGKCVLATNPCDTTTCGPGTTCVPEAHCQALGACVQTCDCSNCGNCGPDNSDGKWNDQQEYCGTPNSSPATMACTTPCPAGEGCIPYSPAICWPMEGCFSL